MQSHKLAVVFLFFVAFFVSEQAFAYLDPGTWAMFTQALIAIGLGALMYMRRIVGYFRGARKGAEGDTDGKSAAES